MIMTDQDHDGSHIKGLIMNYLHTFYPSLLQLPGFLLEFITPIVKARRQGISASLHSFQVVRAAHLPRFSCLVSRQLFRCWTERPMISPPPGPAGQQGQADADVLHHARVRGVEGEPGRQPPRLDHQVL